MRRGGNSWEKELTNEPEKNVGEQMSGISISNSGGDITWDDLSSVPFKGGNSMLETDDLRAAAQALQTYIDDVQTDIQTMNKAATECIDNMGSDQYSTRAALQLQDCAQSLSKTIEEAESLREKILRRAEETEDSQNMI